MPRIEEVIAEEENNIGTEPRREHRTQEDREERSHREVRVSDHANLVPRGKAEAVKIQKRELDKTILGMNERLLTLRRPFSH